MNPTQYIYLFGLIPLVSIKYPPRATVGKKYAVIKLFFILPIFRIKRNLREYIVDIRNTIPTPHAQHFHDMITADVPRHTVLVLDWAPDYHAEVMSSVVWYFLQLGYNVDVVISEKNAIHEGVKCMDFPKERVRLFVLEPPHHQDPIFVENMLRYEYIFLVSVNSYQKFLYSNNYINLYEQKYYKGNFFFMIHSTEEEIAMMPKEGLPYLLQKIVVIFRFPVCGKTLPFISPCYFGPWPTKHAKNKITRFISIGGFRAPDRTRRDVHSMLGDLERLVDEGITNFQLVVIGRRENGAALNLPEKLRPFTRFLGTLTYPQMYREVNDADFLLSGIEIASAAGQEFAQRRTSGHFGLSIGFSKPMIIHPVFAATQGMDKDTAILHDAFGIYEALKRCIDMSSEEYDRYTDNLDKLRAKLQAESIANMEKMFGKPIASS